MTKQEEIDSLSAYLRSLPNDSYLRSILAPLAPQIATMIRDDMADPMAVSEYWQAQASESKKLRELQAQCAAQLREHESKARELQRAASFARGELAEILAAAESLRASATHAIKRGELARSA